jgi:hypothetical protein
VADASGSADVPRLATTSRCDIDDCGGKIYGHGMCRKHYDRWRRHGDPRGKARRATLEERFWVKVDKRGPDDCWPWQGAIQPAGYGQIWAGGKLGLAHRVAYELLVGPIPDGLELDHLCHTRDTSCRLGNECPHRRCVNPAHLEPVPQVINGERSRSPHADNARKTHCPQGHPYDEANTYHAPNGSRECRACAHEERDRQRVREAERRALGLPLSIPKTHCPAGHEYAGENLSVSSTGTPVCHACKREQTASRRRKARENKAPRILKLSDEDVAYVRQQWATGTVSKGSLARKFGVTVQYISLIIQNKTRRIPA